MPLCPALLGPGVTGTWSKEGRILFAGVEGAEMNSVSTAGGAVTVEFKPDSALGEARALFPAFLPDGRKFLYLLRMKDGTGWLMVREPGQPPRRVMPISSNVAFVEPNHLVFAQSGALMGQAFDARTSRAAPKPA